MENSKDLPLLNAEEIRVIGCLIEKSRTTPDYYPMTLNALTLACNQKSSRKPVVEYDEETVVLTLDTLKKKGLIATATGGGSRTVKYKHNLAIVYPLVPAELAVICLLFLRGPLTPGEIKTNSNRLYDFESLEDVQAVLEKLASSENPYITTLPRKTGQKEIRYAHLFAGEPIVDEDDFKGEPARKSVGELESRVAKLEQDYAELKSAFDKLYQELMG
ncbi:YceH family protein [Pelobium sp.]|nr:YceH family protein [Pelobium sp.]MDA9555134.1 YceH family protein [Pelobium sp.]